ncbi:Alcohol dehydrogenase-like 2-like protein [Drosera capensis]
MATEANTKVSAVTANFSTSRTAGKPIICKVCRKAGEPLVIEEIQVAPPKAWEVRVKILCTSLCHTDVTVWRLNVGSSAVFPRIFGHEASCGDHVEEVKEGDTVLPILLPNCGECRECEFKKSNFCSTLGHQVPHAMARDGTSRFKDMNGETLHHFCFVSSFSEYTVVDVAQVVKVDPRMSIDKACLLGCCVPTGVGSAWKVAAVEEGHSVAIFGLGAVGLAVAEGARLRGVSKIIGIDLNPLKFEIAKKFGVTDVINPKECGDSRVSQVIKELTDGGADYCFECVGLASLVEEAFQSSRAGGKTIVVGADYSGNPLKFNFGEVLFGRSVIGSLFGGIKPKKDIPIIMQKYINKELRLDGFITHEVSFQEINKAFDYLLQGKSIRCLIWMDE